MIAMMAARYYYFPATRSTLLPSFRHGHYVTLRMYACLSQKGYLPPGVNNKCTLSAAPIVASAALLVHRPYLLHAPAGARVCSARDTLNVPVAYPPKAASRSSPYMERGRGQNMLFVLNVGTASEKRFNNITYDEICLHYDCLKEQPTDFEIFIYLKKILFTVNSAFHR
jgi:hypothetical protein